MWSNCWWHQVPLSRIVLAPFTFFTPGRQKNPPPPRRHCYTVLKKFPSNPVNRDSSGALVVAVPCSGMLLGWCWGSLGAPQLTPHHWGLPSPLPQLHQVTLFGLCLLPPRLVPSIFWELSADWVSPVHRRGIYGCFCTAYWLRQL